MSTDESTPGREPIILVELDQDLCNLTYGEAPCQAELGVTGPRKCFNTRQTCQDPDNYDRGTLTLTFAEPRANLPRDRNIIPLLERVSTTPTRINVGGGDRNTKPLGQRATVDVRFKDAPHSDLRVDKYRDERDYDPLDRGTFWSKWMRRNPYYQNRRLRVREGYVGQDPEDMRTRHYFIDRINGPGSDGRVNLRAKDVLKLADDERAQWPEQSTGTLDADLPEGTTSEMRIRGATVSDYDPDSNGSGTVTLGDEVIDWSSASMDGDVLVLSGLTRGVERTETDDHDEDDTVQRCVRYDDVAILDVVQELLERAGNVPPEFLPIAAWQAEANVWLQGVRVSTILTEPYGVTSLLSELTEQCLFYIWWDERDQEIKLKTVRPPDPGLDGNIRMLDDERNVVADSVSITEEPGERVSQVWTAWRQIDPTEDLDELSNFRRVRINADANAESDDQYGERRVRRVYARWVQADAQVITLNARLLARYRDNPQYVTLQLDAKDRELSTGDVVDLQIRQLQDDTGAPLVERYQIIKAKEVEPGHLQEYTLQRFLFRITARFANFMRNDAPVYGDASNEEKQDGGYFSDGDNDFPDGGEPYRFI